MVFGRKKPALTQRELEMEIQGLQQIIKDKRKRGMLIKKRRELRSELSALKKTRTVLEDPRVKKGIKKISKFLFEG